MQLNPDCIRDILLSVESVTDFSHSFTYKKDTDINDYLKKYSHEEIIYHIRQCSMSNFITNVHYYDCGETISITDLSPSGHEFLSNIRSDTVWKSTKSIAGKIGSYSIDVLTKIAVGVLTQLINKQLNNF